jgi:hypothetical protein
MNIISERPVSQWDRSPISDTITNLVMEHIEEIALFLVQGPVVQKPINANLGLNLLNLGLNFNPIGYFALFKASLSLTLG